MPRWVRWLQPLLSGVFTVDNLDYVRRDAYLTGVAVGPVDVERLRRYTFIASRRPDPLRVRASGRSRCSCRPACSCTSRSTSTGRSGRSTSTWPRSSGRRSGRSSAARPLGALAAYADLDEYALLHQAARWAAATRWRSVPWPATAGSRRRSGRLWRGILLRRPRWRAVTEVRRDSRHGGRDEAESLLAAGARRGDRLDLAETDAQPEYARKLEGRLLVARRDGSADAAAMGELLDRLPAVVVVGPCLPTGPRGRLTMSAGFLAALRTALPDLRVLTEAGEVEAYRYDETEYLHPGMPLAVAFPTTTADVATIVRLAAAHACRSCRGAPAPACRAGRPASRAR